MRQKSTAGMASLLLLFSVGCSARSRVVSPEEICGEYWMGIYLLGYKVGFSHINVEQDKESRRGGFRILSESRINVSILGQQMQTEVVSLEQAGPDLAPKHLDTLVTSGGRSMRVVAEFKPEEVRCQVTSGDETSDRVVPIPEGVGLDADPELSSRARDLQPGEEQKFHYFNPLTLAIEAGALKALKWEETEYQGKQVKALAIELKTDSMALTSWADEEGEVIKMAHAMGLTMVREPKEVALQGETREYAPAPDLASVARVRTAEPISNPRGLSLLRVRISGLGEMRSLPNGRQRVVSRNDKELVLEVKAKALPDSGPSLPFEEETLKPYLQSTNYINSASEEIVSLARSIVGQEKDSARVAREIATWVNQNLRPRGDMGVVRAATDVLATRSGVCRDYAALYTALARAAGLPTRLAGGLCYWRDGFYYHAWAESYLGEWVAVDPTIESLYADATHIKLTEGDLTDLFTIGAYIGRMEIEVLEAK